MSDESTSAKEKAEFEYGEKFNDMSYEYRIVVAPHSVVDKYRSRISRGITLTETEWRAEGVVMSRGWEHALWFPTNMSTLLFRRPVGTNPVTGIVDEAERAKIVEDFKKQYPTEA